MAIALLEQFGSGVPMTLGRHWLVNHLKNTTQTKSGVREGWGEREFTVVVCIVLRVPRCVLAYLGY